MDEEIIRVEALAWLDVVSGAGEMEMTRDQLANDFSFRGVRFPLIDRGKGIRRPGGWSAALSITTTAPKSGSPAPYDDVEGADGLHRYKLRRDEGGKHENEGLRAAMGDGLPIAWFFGLRPGVFSVISPVYLVAEEPEQSQFVLALSPAQRMITPGSTVEAGLRAHLMRETRQRLHQRVFASQVLLAYRERCAVCSLNHRPLLDAAHIIADNQPRGLPIVENGLALCKIHHAAYDRNILGVRPDYRVEIREEILLEVDGPMLRHGLQELHGGRLMALPSRRQDQPDPDRLEERYVQFRNAS